MQRPDIIFIVLDTQRADRLGCYGYEPLPSGTSISPNFDRFSKGGTLFEQAISPAQWTIPSHASMFTGLYPTAHQVTQSHHSLGNDQPHLVETLAAFGYRTFGFCNNPLVGILDNGLKRGFERFYNYGGAIPSMPQFSSNLPWPANSILEKYTQFLRRISYPIQNFFGRSDLAFRVSLSAWLTPLWSKMANFKGQNERSVHDVCRFLQEREADSEGEPLFLFINLMETHFPFWPPGEFVDRIAPYMKDNREAREIMRRWNREAYLWQTPLTEPLQELESDVLNDMYDAEVAYQDDYLGQLFDTLASRANADNTLTIVVSDHGDGLGEHSYFGHAFVAYQELVHVPLVVHWPVSVPAQRRVKHPVSTRRVYHTVLDAAGIPQSDTTGLELDDLHELTLLKSIHGQDPEQNQAYAEVYPPLNFAKAIKHRQPQLLEQFRCMSTRRTVIKDNMKLIQVDEQPDELFDLENDPLELEDILLQKPSTAADLVEELEQLERLTQSQRERLATGATIDLEIDEHLLQRLRGLGYIE